jgi:hypothetical protein
MKELKMNSLCKSVAAIGLAALAGLGLAGCVDHKPEGYYNERPPVDELYHRDRGLQSSEVVEASDLLVERILSLPEVNRSPTRLTVVFTGLEDLTTTRQFNYDIFLERLKTNIAEQGRDRIAIVSNRDNYYRTRSEELDIPIRERDEFGQGDGHLRGVPIANRIQPDFAMTGKVMEIRNRGTSYYLFTFSLADIRSNGGGLEIPLRYEVKVRK